MQRGATEQYKFNFNNANVADMTAIRVAFVQEAIKVIKDDTVLIVDTETNSVTASLSQEETLLFEDKKLLHIQLKFKDVNENVETTKIFTDSVYPILDEEVI